eukprot:CAMPEP_0198216676 /NCGR_PEP_ID=MMETSP1445-20131203/59011_1 /TAXON_ID=36898 /ORGANISM="Pyramimonas sp., Strain CCMP2087" /LENGTH=57 /DNA_ID=CAMNT_0043893017 /DNA_START=215 /DNA_END=388 /DNA_ORIENTATION=+
MGSTSRFGLDSTAACSPPIATPGLTRIFMMGFGYDVVAANDWRTSPSSEVGELGILE